MREEKITCIVCPRACTITLTIDSKGRIINIIGYGCNRGKIFAKEEITNPKRIITTTIRIENGLWKMLPVRTVSHVPKQKQFEILKEIHKIIIKAPVKMNQIIIRNVSNTGVDVIAERDMSKF